ncbi:uncharacterized protein LOC144164810 [Haemaphysalis longicornis]
MTMMTMTMTLSTGTRLALAPDKRPARTPPLAKEPGPSGNLACPQSEPELVGDTTLLSASLRRSHLRVVAVPAEGRHSAWSVPQLCGGLCAVSIFLLSALFATTLAFHTVNRVNLVSNLLRQIVRDAGRGGHNETASAATPLPRGQGHTATRPRRFQTEDMLPTRDLVDAANDTERDDSEKRH